MHSCFVLFCLVVLLLLCFFILYLFDTTRSMLLNGVCDRECANAACGWDFNDCCDATFASSVESLGTKADTTVWTLRIDNDDATPYSSWTGLDAELVRATSRICPAVVYSAGCFRRSSRAE